MSQIFEEFEAKFLDINPATMAKKIESLGAKRQYKKLFRRYVFDFPDRRLNSDSSWLRLLFGADFDGCAVSGNFAHYSAQFAGVKIHTNYGVGAFGFGFLAHPIHRFFAGTA